VLLRWRLERIKEAIMKQRIRLREKGQITLPQEVLDQLALQKDELLEVSIEGGRIVLEQVTEERRGSVSASADMLADIVGLVALGGDAVRDSARYDE
jgi:bifunctional DNA-binding transcriptional regulator/antitoxin component of YhaV-PrlF toxin-antitoxin module